MLLKIAANAQNEIALDYRLRLAIAERCLVPLLLMMLMMMRWHITCMLNNNDSC